ncbi:sensor histidine kinase [Eubacterium oxidoreducens]|uniref:Histidine kinase n=1 Tax=Eubacterium oxidoreducens TaxID=1732 RepID=A0A1G6BRB6_EUBOX|nr:PocR ligand-binding domain-containing protein [Eubacterium oxidoreducens]SDB23174.1 Histidine kinase [Eubacterium oxidoreducens]
MGQRDSFESRGVVQTDSFEKQVNVDLNHFDIVHLFGKEKLEEIQEKISKVTGLAFVTVDYKGEPVTKSVSFTRFCQCVRGNHITEQGCWSSDAYGAIQAATTKKSCIYFCPCGLLEVAIPLIVEGHYLGGFIGGQILCEDAPKDIVRLEAIFDRTELIKQSGIDMSLKQEATKLTYEQFCNASELAAMIIRQMTESEISKLERSITDHGKIESLKQENKNLKYQNKLKELRISALSYEKSPQFVINTVTTIANLAMIEGATETNEALIVLAEYIKSMMNTDSFIYMIDEIDNVERYLQIQKIRHGDKLSYNIEIPEKMRMQRMPALILQPFVQQAVEHGISLNENGGLIQIVGRYVGDDVMIYVEDDGPGLGNEAIEQFYSTYDRYGDGDGIQQSIERVSRRIRTLFGKEYDITTEVVEGKGRKACIRFPKYFDERMDADESHPNS